MAMSPEQASRWSLRGAIDTRVQSAAFAVLAFTVVVTTSSPRFIYWYGLLNDSTSRLHPETNRASCALRQLHDPFLPIDDLPNRVLRWRLLFPAVGHLFHLPDSVYLALPALGCLLVFGFISRVLPCVSESNAAVFLGTILTGTVSWFFVSTGWLAYFDSWYILGMLIVSFSSSRRLIALACLATPWADERFVLTLPLCLLVRHVYRQENRRELLQNALWIAAPVGVYTLVRLSVLILGSDSKSSEHLASHLLRETPSIGSVAYGLWMALRANWLLVLLVVHFCIRRGRLKLALLVTITAVLTAAAAGLLAHDLSRSFSVLLPLSVLGTVMVLREWPDIAPKVLATIFVFNLFLPARHVVSGWRVSPSIHSVPVEIARFWHPPADFFQYYLDRGNTLADEGRCPKAMKEFEQATRINPDSTDAWVLLGLCHMRLNQPKSAVSDFSAAIRLDPEDPFARYNRGLARRSRGDIKGAVEDLRTALKGTPQSSPQRPRIESALEEALSHPSSLKGRPE